MTTLLEEAIAKLRELPEAEQDEVATALFAVLNRPEQDCRLTLEQIEEVKRTEEGLRNGSIKLLTVEETEKMWQRLGA